MDHHHTNAINNVNADNIAPPPMTIAMPMTLSQPCQSQKSKMVVPYASFAPRSSDKVAIHGKIYYQVHPYVTVSVSPSKRSSTTQSLVDCVMNGGIGGTDVHVLSKAHCAEICAIVSQFGYNGLSTSILVQLACWYKSSAMYLAMASDASFQPSPALF